MGRGDGHVRCDPERAAMRLHSLLRIAALLLVLPATACEGALLEGPAGPAGTPMRPRPRPPGVELPAPSTRFARLTEPQWRNAVTDLLRLEGGFPGSVTVTFPLDGRSGGFVFENEGGALSVDQVLQDELYRAAGALAAHVTSDADRLGRILPVAGGTDDERARAFIEGFGLRAHRRPLEATEITEYLALYQAGRALYDGVDPFTSGVRLVVEAMLSSPFFLYRTELATAAAGDMIPLDGYEVASRLSFFLWETMPDDTLFTEAAGGALATEEGVRAAVDRMMRAPAAAATVASFHAQLFDTRRFAGIRPDPGSFPDAPAELRTIAAAELDAFVREIVLGDGGGVVTLLTSRETFVNAASAPLYGLDAGAYGAELTRAALGAERRGVLTQLGFLASHATSTDPDPIHRGVFIAERIACVPIGAPPDDIPPLPAPMGRTNRETVESHTESPGSLCATCHATLINPYGFPFEHFDAVGGLRDLDRGNPIDTTSSPLIDGEPMPVADAADLAESLAASPAVHRCYSRHWMEFALGRAFSLDDAPTVARLAMRSQAESLSVRALIEELAVSAAFRNRSTEELP